MDISPDLLQDEEEIIWTENVDNKDYVRQTLYQERFRSRPITYKENGRTVGYSTVRENAQSHETGIKGRKFFYRRVFYLTVGKQR